MAASLYGSFFGIPQPSIEVDKGARDVAAIGMAGAIDSIPACACTLRVGSPY
jgi:hypothetical protein